MRRRTKRRLLVVFLLLLLTGVATGGVVWYLQLQAKHPNLLPEVVETSVAQRKVAPAKAVATKSKKKSATKRVVVVEDEEASFTPEERQWADQLQQALDDEDLKKLLPIAQQMALSTNRDVRAKLPAALGWFGPKALVQLTNLLFDPDKQIASEAATQWKNALNELDDSKLKAEVMQSGLLAITDEDTLGELMMELNDLTNSQQMSIILPLIEQSGNQSAQEAAKDHYLFLTGDDYSGPKDAEVWLKENPDEE